MHRGLLILSLLAGGIFLLSPRFLQSQPTSPTEAPREAPHESPQPWAQPNYSDELLRLTNKARQQAGLSPLQPSSSLNRAAQQQAADMVAHQFVAHQGSDGSTPVDRAKKAGYPSDYIGENIAAGRLTPQATIEGWLNNPRYRANLLNPRYTDVGFGYVYAPTLAYQHYWVQVFGGLVSVPAAQVSACQGEQILTAIACEGDQTTSEEAKLIQLINQYRAKNQLPPIPASAALSLVANRHSRDLQENLAAYDRSGQDWRFGWSNCPYDAQQPTTFSCLWSAPQRLKTGYLGQAYELICGGNGEVTAEDAIRCWQSHPLNQALLLNQGPWQNSPWQAIGVSLDRNYAIVWLGTVPDKNPVPRSPSSVPSLQPGRIW